MDLLFLGTSSGTPTRARNVSAVALLEGLGKGWHLVDCGEGTQHQVLRSPLSLHELQAIYITHVHGDHCYGLPGLLASAGMSGRTRALPIVAPAGIQAWIEATLRMSETHLPYPLEFQATEALGDWRHGDLRIEATALSHRVPSYAYGFSEASPDPRLDTARLDAEGIPRGPLWGQLAQGLDVEHQGQRLRGEDYRLPTRPPRRVVIAGDNDRPALLAAACRDTQVLVHEATYTRAVANAARAEFGHSTADAVAAFAQSVALPNLVLTHFSPRYQADPTRSPSIQDVRQEAAASYHGRLFLAQDFLRLRLDKDGLLERVEAERRQAP
ncbi:ribonuclease Z [Pseudomonas mangiferae]|uniref:Ribonuclease Z n=1 Tax=Pseudomonas mangiferae TaxID=2593654 RepID=A0A553GU17_9PSED|nr:ribonuclease Z [Pseudomonas mangiferae]TRX73003.1 MBL fold metallo-hydrolase [Pseudomonas mangiferae]